VGIRVTFGCVLGYPVCFDGNPVSQGGLCRGIFVPELSKRYLGGSCSLDYLPETKLVETGRELVSDWAGPPLSNFGTGAYLFNALAINQKNATMAALLEISYPLFIILFTALFFREIHLDLVGMIGAMLILLGCVLVVFSRAG
jgi:hypothetical protein